jgi:hypothetical protein
MNESATSLNRLHDLALPPEVSWWPLAPGWYVILSIGSIILLFLIRRAWKKWRANAYRRAAMRELGSVEEAAAIAELLRRTALAVEPRSVIAGLTGAAWPDWLTRQCPGNMPDIVREQLLTGVYNCSAAPYEIDPLRNYAALWIARHQTGNPD